MTRGKNTFQKFGAGTVNSIGTSDPSEVYCAGRGTCASTCRCVVTFSIVIFVPCGSASAKAINAPVALTV